jgi:hypothetical protein
MSVSKRNRLYVGRSTRHEASACLGCGKELDASTGVGHRSKPRPGCISICLACGHIQAYGAGLKLRELNDQEMVDIAGNEKILVIVKAAGLAREAADKGGYPYYPWKRQRQSRV